MSLNIKVLGGGCANCQNLERNVRSAIVMLRADAEIEHVSIPANMPGTACSPPRAGCQRKLVSGGKVPSPSQIVTLLTNALMEEES